MEVRLLGTGGWIPTDERETSCVYLRAGSEVLLLDAGSGARRLITEPQLLEGVERVSVVFSHFHIDHVSGLTALAGIDVRRELWMAAELLTGVPAPELLHQLVTPPFFTHRGEAGEARELRGDTQIGPFGVEIRVQPQHPGRSIAIKVDGALTYCTDTKYDAENIAFARGSRVLLHDSFRAGETTDDPGHTASGEAGRIAAEAAVERLVLVHVNPEGPVDDELVSAALGRFPATEAGRDGLAVM